MKIQWLFSIVLSSFLVAGNAIPLDNNQFNEHFYNLTAKEKETLTKKMSPIFVVISKKLDDIIKEHGNVIVKFRDKDYNKKTGKFSKAFEVLMHMLNMHFLEKRLDLQLVIFDGDEEGTFGISAKDTTYKEQLHM